MDMTEYKFDPEFVREQVAQKSASLKANRGLSDLLGFGCGLVMQRLSQDRRRYRDYGPYWPALKAVLRRCGHRVGEGEDSVMEQAYGHARDVETLIAADLFRDHYLATHIIYDNQFMLDGSTGEHWTLFDDDMERPAA